MINDVWSKIKAYKQMANKDPKDAFLNKIAAMLDLISKHQGKPFSEKEITPELEKDLEDLQEIMEFYKRVTARAMAKCGIDPDELQKRLAEPKTNFPPDQQKFFEKAAKLKYELAKIDYVYSMYRQAYEMRKKKLEKKGEEKKFGQKRKKKFKRLSGGDKGWMPL